MLTRWIHLDAPAGAHFAEHSSEIAAPPLALLQINTFPLGASPLDTGLLNIAPLLLRLCAH